MENKNNNFNIYKTKLSPFYYTKEGRSSMRRYVSCNSERIKNARTLQEDEKEKRDENIKIVLGGLITVLVFCFFAFVVGLFTCAS